MPVPPSRPAVRVRPGRSSYHHDLAGRPDAKDDTCFQFSLGQCTKPSVQIVVYTGGIAAFMAKPDYSQQCFITSEPVLAGKQRGDPQTFLVADLGYNPYTTVVIAK